MNYGDRPTAGRQHGWNEPPLRLALGNDAVDGVSGALDDAKAEPAAWERVGRATVFEG
jgi:hypothetical protein